MDRHVAWTSDFDEAKDVWLLAELTSVRSAVLGYIPLVALLDAGHAPETLSAALFEGTRDDLAQVYQSISEYVTRLALGDAVMRPRQTLLTRRPLAEVYFIFPRSAPDWTELRQYVDCVHTRDAFEGDPTWADAWSTKGYTWRARFEQALEDLVRRFQQQVVTPTLEVMSKRDPAAILKAATPAMFDEALAAIQPFPANLTEAIEIAIRDDIAMPDKFERAYYEELHARGGAVWHSLALQFHLQGVALTEQAVLLPLDSHEQLERQIEASKALALASLEPQQSVASLVGGAALFLKMQHWHTARTLSQLGLEAAARRDNEAPTLHSKRAACAMALRTGPFATLPAALKPSKSQKAKELDHEFQFMLVLTLGHSHGGLCRSVTTSQYAHHDEAYAHADKSFKLAIAHFQQAQSLTPESDWPRQGMQSLTGDWRAYKQRFKARDEIEGAAERRGAVGRVTFPNMARNPLHPPS